MFTNLANELGHHLVSNEFNDPQIFPVLASDAPTKDRFNLTGDLTGSANQ